MATLHTCGCGFETRICRDEVTAEQWQTFEAFHRLAYDWAVAYMEADDAERFAERYASEYWDDEEPPSFPAVYDADRRAAERKQAEAEAAERKERGAQAKRAEAKARAAARRRAHNGSTA